jgi:hypothetical protein
MPLVSRVTGAAAASVSRRSSISGSRNGSPPVTKNVRTPSGGASAAIWRIASRPSARRRADATVVALQVAVEVHVQPKALAERPFIVDGCRCRDAVAQYPSGAAVLVRGCNDRMSGQPRPRVEVGGERRRIGRRDGKEIARRGPVERGDHLEQQTRRKGPAVRVDLEAHGQPRVH